MRGKTHCTIGILTTIQTCLIFNIPINLFNIIVSGIFAILPDLDEPNSTISDFFFKKKISKFILKILIYIINIFIFFISLKINDNFYLSSIITFVAITIIESKLKHSLLRKFFLSLMFIFLAFCLYLININIYIIIFIAIFSIFPWLKHRSFSHSLLGIFFIYFLLKQIELVYNISNLSIIGTISYSSHIFLGDIFTKSGVPVFYPVINKNFSLGFFRVGSFLGNLVEILVVVFLILIISSSIIK